jgi:hypothetical protein
MISISDETRFNQAWRKRTTLPFTRAITRSCDAFDGSSVSTDILIRPLTKITELMSRVNDHFSYPDIDDAEVRGEMMLDMSATSFLAELSHIKESTFSSPLLQGNSKSSPKPILARSLLMATSSDSKFDDITDRYRHQ